MGRITRVVVVLLLAACGGTKLGQEVARPGAAVSLDPATRQLEDGAARLRQAQRAAGDLIQLTQAFLRHERAQERLRLERLERAAAKLVEAAEREPAPAPAAGEPLVSVSAINASAPPLATREALLQKIAEVSELLPADDAIAIESDLRQATATTGHLLTSLLSAFAPGVGVSSYCEENAIFHRWLTPEGRSADGPAALNEYFATVATADNPGQMQQVVVELTRVQEALYCFSIEDLSAFDLAYREAMQTLLARLKSSGRTHMARVLWDTSLPVTLLVFDTLKRFQRPHTMDVLRLPADLSLPPPRGAGDASLTGFADSLASELYCQGDRQLTLNRVGVWLPDIVAGGRLAAPLGSMGSAGLCRFLELGTDPLRLGEGDCPLSEMLLDGMFCASDKTCAPAGASEGAPGRVDLSLLGTRAGKPLPGTPASSLTVFGVDRSAIPRDHCSGGAAPGGAVAAQCGGPALSGAGRFSKNPREDRQLRCAMRYAGSAGLYTASIKLPSRSCLVSKDGQADPIEGIEEGEAPDADPGDDVGDEQHRQERILEKELAAKMRAIANDPARWAQVVASGRASFPVFDEREFRRHWLGVARGLQEGTTHSIALQVTDSMRARDRSGECCLTGANGVQIISIDPRTPASERLGVAMHEGGHAALDVAEGAGAIGELDPALAPPNETPERERACRNGDVTSCGSHHAFMRGAGLYQCGTSDVECNLGCNGLSAYFERLARCEEGDAVQPLDPYCGIAEDACGDPRARDYRSTMSLSRGCLTPVSLSSLTACAHVLCGDASTMDTPLGECCAGGQLQGGYLGGVGSAQDLVCRYAPDLCAPARP